MTEPEADLIAALIAHEEADRLTAAEVTATVRHLLFIGHEAVTDLVGNAMAALLGHPEQLAELRADPGQLPAAVEEPLRYDGPTARTSPRFALEDVPPGDTLVPAGGIVVLAVAAANRDPRRFASPDRLDIRRDATGHLAFGAGIHASIGAPLARLGARSRSARCCAGFPSSYPAVMCTSCAGGRARCSAVSTSSRSSRRIAGSGWPADRKALLGRS